MWVDGVGAFVELNRGQPRQHTVVCSDIRQLDGVLFLAECVIDHVDFHGDLAILILYRSPVAFLAICKAYSAIHPRDLNGQGLVETLILVELPGRSFNARLAGRGGVHDIVQEPGVHHYSALVALVEHPVVVSELLAVEIECAHQLVLACGVEPVHEVMDGSGTTARPVVGQHDVLGHATNNRTPSHLNNSGLGRAEGATDSDVEAGTPNPGSRIKDSHQAHVSHKASHAALQAQRLRRCVSELRGLLTDLVPKALDIS